MSDNQSNTLEQLHSIELDLLKHFIEICDTWHIRYYVIGGTLLGAVRHGGFIPWDDDIDVAVPRDDYDRLIEVMHKEENKEIGILYYRDKPDLYFYPAKIISKKYRIQDVRMKDGYSYPWIDVLPIDGKPDGKVQGSLFKLHMDWYRLLLAFCYIDNLRDIDRSFAQRAMIRIGRLLRPGRWIDPAKIKDKVDKLLSSHKIEDCSWVGTCMGAYYFHEFVPKEYFGKGSKVMFCGLEVNAPEQVNPYLTHMYGDYMTPPEEQKRMARHVKIEQSSK